MIQTVNFDAAQCCCACSFSAEQITRRRARRRWSQTYARRNGRACWPPWCALTFNTTYVPLDPSTLSELPERHKTQLHQGAVVVEERIRRAVGQAAETKK